MSATSASRAELFTRAGDPSAASRRARLLRRMEVMEFWLDRRFRIPIAGIHIGLDGLLGLIPVVGDGAGALISLWLVWEAHRMGADGWTKGRMLLNILIDFFIGSVPVVGDIADFLFKSNTLNMRLLRRHLAEMEERDWQPLR